MISRKRLTQIGYLGIIGLLVVFAAVSVAAPKADNKGKRQEEADVVEIKELTGVVTALDNSFIAIVYKQDEKKDREYEVALPIDENIKVLHKKSIDQIAEGDTVAIQYEETTTSYKNYKGEEKRRCQRRAKVIKFLNPAEVKPEVIREGE